MRQLEVAPDVLAHRSAFGSWSFEDIGDRFEAVCEWLASMGVNVSPSRIGSYRRNLLDLVTYYKAPGPEHDALATRLPAMLVTLFEVTGMVMIHEGLCNYPDQTSLRRRLRQLATGPEWGSGEIMNNAGGQARDVAFELVTAARCSAGGYEVDLSTQADVIVSRAGHRTIIECKRPQSASALERNLKSALEQLSRRYALCKEQDSARGIVAISIDKATGRAHQFFNAPSLEAAAIEVRKVAQQFLADHRHRWGGVADHRTIGILVNFRAITIVQESNMITVANQDVCDSLAKNSDDDAQLRGIAEALAHQHG